MSELRRKDILTSAKFKEFLLPSVLMSMSTSLSIIVDSVIVGNVLGSTELAAVNLIMPLSLCFTAITAIFGIGASICIPAFKGKMDIESADKCLSLSCIAWLVCSVFTVLLGIFATDTVSGFLSGNSGLNDFVSEYLKIYLLGSPFTFITLIFPHIIRSDGKPKLASNVLIFANSTNLVLDVVFMKFFSMGLAGAALATICGYTFGSLLYLIYVFSGGRTLRLVKIKFRDLKLYGDMVKTSISSVMGQGFMFAKIWIFNMLVSSIAGQSGLTAFSVCTSCLSFASMFIAGAAQTMMPMVGAFKGCGDCTAIDLTVRKALKTVIICCVSTAAVFEIFPAGVLSLFGISDAETVKIGVDAIRLFSPALIGIGISFLFMYYVQASKMPAFSLQICALEGFFIIVPTALLMTHFFGINGFWLAYTVNEIAVIAFIILKAKHTVKKSHGKLQSVFMLEKPQNGTIEFSIDVTDAAETELAVKKITEELAGNSILPDSETVSKLLFEIFALSETAYKAKGKKRRKPVVDITVQNGKLTFKDMGKSHTLCEEIDFGKFGKNITCNCTPMIGINYSEIIYR